MRKATCRVVLALFLAASFQAGAEAAKQNVYTLQVKRLHCAGCAKRVVRRLSLVPGVAKIVINVKKNSVYLFPQANKYPSPRRVWETAEKLGASGDADFTPVRLYSPYGTYSEKPDR